MSDLTWHAFGDYDIDHKAMTQMKVGTTVAQSVRVTAEPDMIRDMLVHRLEAYVLKEHLVTDTYTAERMFRTPATSWQMFKWEHAESWWLGWLMRRRPIQFSEQPHHVTVDVERNYIYPEANIKLPELGRPVIFERLTYRD